MSAGTFLLLAAKRLEQKNTTFYTPDTILDHINGKNTQIHSKHTGVRSNVFDILYGESYAEPYTDATTVAKNRFWRQ